jgi:ribosomal protein L1
MAKAETERVKVTVNLPRELVKAGKIAAIERDEDFQDLLAAGLRLILARKGAAR